MSSDALSGHWAAFEPQMWQQCKPSEYVLAWRGQQSWAVGLKYTPSRLQPENIWPKRSWSVQLWYKVYLWCDAVGFSRLKGARLKSWKATCSHSNKLCLKHNAFRVLAEANVLNTSASGGRIKHVCQACQSSVWKIRSKQFSYANMYDVQCLVLSSLYKTFGFIVLTLN